MKISFITPVYNAEQYLDRCVESVLSITSDEIELILVDDGSKDNSAKICEEYAENDCRIKFITQENAGVSAARNTGLRNASGQYCFFLDADDYLINRNAISLMKEVDSDYDIVGYNYICLYENGLKKEEFYSSMDEHEDTRRFLNRQLLTTHMLHTCWGKLFKKNIIEQHNVMFPVGMKVGEDYMFVLEYCKHIQTCKLINIPVLYYCINSASVMRNCNMTEQYDTWLELMEQTERYYKRCGYEFEHEFYLYQLRTFTAMSRNIVLSCSKDDMDEYMERIQNEKRIQAIVNHVDLSKLGKLKKFEVKLIKKKRWIFFRCYFITKALVQRLREDV